MEGDKKKGRGEGSVIQIPVKIKVEPTATEDVLMGVDSLPATVAAGGNQTATSSSSAAAAADWKPTKRKSQSNRIL